MAYIPAVWVLARPSVVSLNENEILAAAERIPGRQLRSGFVRPAPSCVSPNPICYGITSKTNLSIVLLHALPLVIPFHTWCGLQKKLSENPSKLKWKTTALPWTSNSPTRCCYSATMRVTGVNSTIGVCSAIRWLTISLVFLYGMRNHSSILNRMSDLSHCWHSFFLVAWNQSLYDHTE